MKKQILVLLSVLICSMSLSFVEAKTAATPAVNAAIKLYKAQNYSESYTALKTIVEKDPSNALAYYYLAMASAQLGKKDEAIENYDKVLVLSPNGQLHKYASKGRTCLTDPERCNEDFNASEETEEDRFIKGVYGTGFSTKVRSDYEKHKIENLMREMNRKDDLSPQKFKDYKDFSGQVPTNDEIVAALRVLQRAGLENIIGNNSGISDLSMITGNQYTNDYALLNMLTGNNNSNNINPQMIQSLLTNQMSLGF